MLINDRILAVCKVVDEIGFIVGLGYYGIELK